MLSMIHAEFRKITTIRGPWLLLAAGPLVVIAGIAGLIASGGNVRDPSLQGKAFAHVGLAAIVTLIFGILAVSGEYRHRTVTDTYLSSPRRGRVVVAKLAVYGTAGAAAGLVSSLTALAVTAVWWAERGSAVHLSAAGTWATLGGGVAANAAFAVIGVGAGALIRSPAAAVATALVWIALVEGIAGQLLGSGLSRWLPFYASEALDRSDLTVAPTQLLSQWLGGVVLLGYAVAFAAAAAITTLRRDVT